MVWQGDEVFSGRGGDLKTFSAVEQSEEGLHVKKFLQLYHAAHASVLDIWLLGFT